MKKHILCLGDSNTHGYCADPADCADHGIRFNEDERWTCRLQKALGVEYLVTEEGLSGRTTVFVDPIHESMDALSVAYALLKSHEVIDLLDAIGHQRGLAFMIHDTNGGSWRGADGQRVRAGLNGVSVTPLEPMLFGDTETYVDRITSIQRIRPRATP